MPKPLLDDDALDVLASTVGLELSPERREILIPILNDTLALLDMLNQVDVGETPPLHSFDPRWRS